MTEKNGSMFKKEEIINIYQNLLQKIWDRIVVTLGAITLSALWRRVIRKTTLRFPFIEELSMGSDGVDFSQIKKKMNETEKEMLKEGFEELILNFFELLAELTGDMIVNNLFKEKILDEMGKKM